MSSQDNNPYAAPQAELTNLPASEKPAIDGWLGIFAINCIVPAFFGLSVTGYAYGYTAMFFGVIILYLASYKLRSKQPKIFNRIRTGAKILFVLQIFLFFHIIIGLFCFDLVRVIERRLPSIFISKEDRSDAPIFYTESWPGALLLTLFVGVALSAFAYILGLIFGMPARIKQSSNEIASIHDSTNTQSPRDLTESS
jgi:uncharacterized membrane protein